MKKYIYILLFILLAACDVGKTEDPKPVFEIDSDFLVHVESFYAEASARGYGDLPRENLKMIEHDVTKDTDGMRTSLAYKKRGQNIIEIFKCYPENCREAIVYRELAHLLLGKPYSDDYSNIMSPGFDMCTYVHVDGDFYDWREEYMVQLFGAN